MSTKFPLLLDENVPEELIQAIQRLADKVTLVRETAAKGKLDEVVMNYAKDNGLVLVTTETGINEVSFPVCSHPGIIIFATRARHAAIQAGVFQRFWQSGHRKNCKDAVTYLTSDRVDVKTHEGDSSYRV